MNTTTLAKLQAKYPHYQEVFQRLYQNYQVVPCSSYFRFNLNKLMLIIVNKMGKEAIPRFNNFLNDQLDKLPFAKAKEYSNLIVVDPNRNRKLFDLTEMRI